MKWITENKKLFIWLMLIVLLILSGLSSIVIAYTMPDYQIYEGEIKQNATKIMLLSFLTGTVGGSFVGVIIKGTGEWLDGKPDESN